MIGCLYSNILYMALWYMHKYIPSLSSLSSNNYYSYKTYPFHLTAAVVTTLFLPHYYILLVWQCSQGTQPRCRCSYSYNYSVLFLHTRAKVLRMSRFNFFCVCRVVSNFNPTKIRITLSLYCNCFYYSNYGHNILVWMYLRFQRSRSL